MSLPEELWIALRLERDVVQARADYFTAYARSDSPLFDVGSLVHALRDGPIASGDQAVVSLSSSQRTGPIAELRRRIAGTENVPTHPRWVRVAERADALRQAAMAELLYDTRGGVRTLMRSAGEYRTLGLPFGLFLETAVTGSRDHAYVAGRQLRLLLNPDSPSRRADEDLIGLDQALRVPAQQVAVLYTAMSQADAIYEFRLTGDVLAAATPAGRSAPVGTTAQPLALWWECGRLLTELASGRPDARDELRTLIAEFAAAHGLQLRNAQFDGFSWPVAAARLDLVDLYLAGLVAVSARLLHQVNEPSWDTHEDFDGLSPLAQVSIQIGLDLANSNGGRFREDGPEPRTGPTSDVNPDHNWRSSPE